MFARVRSVRRRRTAGDDRLAAATVVAVSLCRQPHRHQQQPPVTGTPGAPTTVVTGPPTASPAAQTAQGCRRQSRPRRLRSWDRRHPEDEHHPEADRGWGDDHHDAARQPPLVSTSH